MNEGIQQWGPGYGPQAAAMHTFSLAAQLSSSARRPIQTPDVEPLYKSDWKSYK